MVCPTCASKTDIINSRPQKRANTVWRRRRCLSCTLIFTTIESTEWSSALVIEDSTGSLQPFLRDKLFVSIYGSLGHRSTALTDAAELTATCIGKIISLSAGKISAQEVRVIVHEVLSRFDTVAGIHYAAFHP